MKDDKIQLFRNNFQDKEEPLVLYGTGIIASELLPELKDYNIVGILDKDRKKGELCGVPILDLDKICEFKVKKIIVAAAQKHSAIIYRRIASFCNLKGIIVYDLCGQDLSEMYGIHEFDIPYFHKSWKDLDASIEKYKIISFDIFDTLLIRKVLYPDTIFKVIEKKFQKIGFKIVSFSKIRMEAARAMGEIYGAPDIFMIYDEIQRKTRICDNDKKKLINIEIETEKSFIQPRVSMLKYFNRIKKYKTIYLVSNMHLPRGILEDILRNCGYTGYKDILISCEYGKGKQNGLFNVLLDKAGIPAKHILHIGDSMEMDDVEPKKAGINTFPIMSMYNMMLNSSYASLLDYDTTLLNQITLGYFIKSAFDDPFVLYQTKGRLRINQLEIYVDMFLNPLVLYFALWILKESKRLNVDHILYLSRDAYLLEQVNSIIMKNQSMKKTIQGSYFYVSRRATLLAAVYDENDAEELARYASFKGSVADLFSIRFGVQIDEITNSEDSEEYNIEYFINKYRDDIIKNSTQQRINYKTYINKMNLSQANYIAVVEQQGYGSIQKSLSKIMKEKKIHGLFLKNIPGILTSGEYSSFFPVKAESELNDNFRIAYLVLEAFLSSPEPSLISFDEKGNPMLEKETRGAQQLKNLAKMHSYALKYCDEISCICPNMIEENIDWQFVNTILGFLDEKYSVIEIVEFIDMIIEDNFGQSNNIRMVET